MLYPPPPVVIPSLSLRPGKLVLYNTIVRPTVQVAEAESLPEPERAPSSIQLDAFLHHLQEIQVTTVIQEVVQAPAAAPRVRASNAHGFVLSPQAQKNMRDKVAWLYHYAKNQTITTTNGKVLAGFKMNFMTLKLPSVQQHTSDFITKNCLNQLITELAKKYQFRNYVWRLEYQKNGNLHYHIATDTYVDFYWLRGAWNRILNKYGYVDAYKARFSAMSFSEYCHATDFTKSVDFDTLKHRYAEGCRNGWKQPNSVDVKCVTNHKKIAYYISKYMGKGSKAVDSRTLPICEENSAHSRLWFCSRSLSRLKAISDFQELFNFDLVNFLDTEMRVVRRVFDYCVCYYFDWPDLSVAAKRLFGGLFREYGQRVGYI